MDNSSGLGTQQQPQGYCVKCGAVLWNLQVCNQCGASHPNFDDPITPGPWPAIRIGLGIVAALLLALATYRGKISAEMIGYWIGTLIFPAIIAATVLSKKKDRLHRFSYWFMWASFVCAVLATVGHLPSSHSYSSIEIEKRVADIAKEAAGTKPIDNSGTPEEREMWNALRDLMRAAMIDRKQHDADANAYALDLASLYSAKSFSTKAAMNKALGAVNGISAVDKDYYRKFQWHLDEMKRRLAASAMDDFDKEAFLKGVNSGLESSELFQQREELMRTEDAWVKATDDLYTFALQHASQIHTTGKQLVIGNTQVRQEFNQQLSKALDSRKKLRAGNEKLRSLREGQMKGFGLTDSDLGLKK